MVFEASQALCMLVCVDTISEEIGDRMLFAAAATYSEGLPYYNTVPLYERAREQDAE